MFQNHDNHRQMNQRFVLEEAIQRWRDTMLHQTISLRPSPESQDSFEIQATNFVLGRGGQSFLALVQSSGSPRTLALRVEPMPTMPLSATDSSVSLRRSRVACAVPRRNLRHLTPCVGVSFPGVNFQKFVRSGRGELYPYFQPLSGVLFDHPTFAQSLKNPQLPNRSNLMLSMLKSLLASSQELQICIPEYIEGSSWAQKQCYLQHCHIKVENVLLDELKKCLRVCDYGSISIGEIGKVSHLAGNIGTPGTMAPEFSQGVLSDRTDVFSSALAVIKVFGNYPLDPNRTSAGSIGACLGVSEDDLAVQTLGQCLAPVGARPSASVVIASLDGIPVDLFASHICDSVEPFEFARLGSGAGSISEGGLQGEGITVNRWRQFLEAQQQQKPEERKPQPLSAKPSAPTAASTTQSLIHKNELKGLASTDLIRLNFLVKFAVELAKCPLDKRFDLMCRWLDNQTMAVDVQEEKSRCLVWLTIVMRAALIWWLCDDNTSNTMPLEMLVASGDFAIDPAKATAFLESGKARWPNKHQWKLELEDIIDALSSDNAGSCLDTFARIPIPFVLSIDHE